MAGAARLAFFCPKAKAQDFTPIHQDWFAVVGEKWDYYSP